MSYSADRFAETALQLIVKWWYAVIRSLLAWVFMDRGSGEYETRYCVFDTLNVFPKSDAFTLVIFCQMVSG